ncbi:MAG: GEVED domain-containing protein [Pirellulaceae bacterium]
MTILRDPVLPGVGEPEFCGPFFEPIEVGAQPGVGANFFASNHAILDNDIAPGQLGYDLAILDFLRGQGTTTEIPRAEYSIAIVGNVTSTYAFSNNNQFAPGFGSTNFFDLEQANEAMWQDILGYDAVIILSHETAVSGGLTDSQLDNLTMASQWIADAVNEAGVDLWVGAGGTSEVYHDFLPDGALTTIDQADTLTALYQPTLEASVVGVTTAMVNAAGTSTQYSAHDGDFFPMEIRGPGNFISIGGRNIGFIDNEVVDVTTLPTSLVGNSLSGVVFQDLNDSGFRDANETGLAGFMIYMDTNGDGRPGLCEPAALTNARGEFTLYHQGPGTYQVIVVPQPGYLHTTPEERWITVHTDGTVTLNAPLEFGMLDTEDTGNPGAPSVSVPVVQGVSIGASPIADDGVYFTSEITPGGTAQVTVVTNARNAGYVLNAWADFNKDGDFSDSGEQILKNIQVQAGNRTTTYTFEIPANMLDDSNWPEGSRAPMNVRFRIGPTHNVGAAHNDIMGEVEDYQVYVSQPADSGLRVLDDIFYYTEEVADQTFNVLANDYHVFNRTLTIVPGSVQAIMPETDPPLEITISEDGQRILFDATEVAGLTEDITFTYTVRDTTGTTAVGNVTLIAQVPAEIDDEDNGNGNGNDVRTFHNANNPVDVNGDGMFTLHDLNLMIRELTYVGSRDLPALGRAPVGFKGFVDINGDGQLSFSDLTRMVNIVLTADGPIRGESIELEPLDLDPNLDADTASSIGQPPVAVDFDPVSTELPPPSLVIPASEPVGSHFLTSPISAPASRLLGQDLDALFRLPQESATDMISTPSGFNSDPLETWDDYSPLLADDWALLCQSPDTSQATAEIVEIDAAIFAEEDWEDELLTQF